MINGNEVNMEFTEVNGIAGDVIIFILGFVGVDLVGYVSIELESAAA